MKNYDTEIENALSYNEHAIFMSRIAIELLNGNIDILSAKGVKEIIAMYLLIPYITNKQLDTPDSKYYNIPKLDINSLFSKVQYKDGSLSKTTLDGIRNAICHSFVSLTEKGDLILDDRASLDKKVHSTMLDKGFCNSLEVGKTSKKLLSLHMDVIRQQQKFVHKLLNSNNY